MNPSWITLHAVDTPIRVYYTDATPPHAIDGCIIAWYRVIYIAGIPQMLTALKDRVDSNALDSMLINLITSQPSPFTPTYIGIKDGKPT